MRSVIMLAALALAGCGLLSGGDTPRGGKIDWPAVVECGPDVPDVVATVSRILLDGSGFDIDEDDRAELERVAAEHGPRTVICLVDLLIQEWVSPGATQTQERFQAVERGRDFLRETGTRVMRVDEGG